MFFSFLKITKMDVSVALFVGLLVRTLIFAPPCLAARSGSHSAPTEVNGAAEDGNNCATKNACDKCIRTYGCVWCSDPDINVKRCQHEELSKCDPKFVTPQNKNEHSEKTVLWTSKIVNITTRPNEGHPLTYQLSYQQAKNHPLDIYYIMELSVSFQQEKARRNFSALGNDIRKKISSMTDNLQLGFGSFVEKPIMPFTYTAPQPVPKPKCGTGTEEQCVPTYAFRNHLPLTKDTNSFKEVIENLSLSTNKDRPESGFDGILQAAVCGKKIGWRDNARKLIVFNSNSPFHIAGDGKLGGIVTPNDGCCHLDENGYYDFSTVQDYPSISQLNAVLKNESINVIFAVNKENEELYKMLTNTMDGAFLGIKNEKGTDITSIIEEQYQSITSSVKIRSEDLGDHLKVKYYSSCLNVNDPPKETNKCEGLQVNSAVNFTIQFELISCPNNSAQWDQTFSIVVDGIKKERTKVNVKMQCDCDCNQPGHQLYEEHSRKCSSHGTLKCGLCDCDDGYSGHNCSCPFNADETTNCRANDQAPLCSNQGSCICNKCQCNSRSPTEVFRGDYCERNNFSCPRKAGLLCSGKGKCDFNSTCVCDRGWTGEDCSCENRTSNCVAPTGPAEEICSGHGDCVCNKCVCRKNGNYTGRYCERCPDCPTKCEELQAVTLCIHRDLNLLDQKHCYENYKYNITHDVVKNLQEKRDLDLYVTCKQTNDQMCYIFSAYRLSRTQINVTVQEDIQCESPPKSPLIAILFIFWSIVAGGLICLLIWKAFAIFQDRREYAKFEAERSTAQWTRNQNPLYTEPCTQYRNPLYENEPKDGF